MHEYVCVCVCVCIFALVVSQRVLFLLPVLMTVLGNEVTGGVFVERVCGWWCGTQCDQMME